NARGPACQCLFAEFMSIQAGLASHPAGSLVPRQFGKLSRHSRFGHKRVSYIDEEFKSYGELIIQQARGDEHALRVAGIDVAMADGAFCKTAVVTLGDQGLFPFADR